MRGAGRHLAAGAARRLADEQLRARSTAAAAMPAQTDDQHRCATGVMVCAWILS